MKLFPRLRRLKISQSLPVRDVIAADGAWITRNFPELDFAAKLLGNQIEGLGLFEPVLLDFAGEPDCFYEGEGTLPYRGQEAAKQELLLEIRSIGKLVPRIKTLLSGPAGTGKTTLAHIMVKLIREQRAKLGQTEGALWELMPQQIKDKEMLDQFMRAVARDPFSIVFIDEAHELQNLEAFFRVLQDNGPLWYPMADGSRLPIADTISWIFATTEPGKWETTTGGAMSRRVHPQIRLEPPGKSELAQIIQDSGQKFGVEVVRSAAEAAAARSLFPWQAKLIFDKALKIATIENMNRIGDGHVSKAFTMMQLDENGLLSEDRDVLKSLLHSPYRLSSGITRYKLSEEALCAAAGVDRMTYKKKVQPKLIRLGYLTTVGGQSLTERALTEYGWLKAA